MSRHIDLTAADRLEILADNLEKQGIHFYLTEVPEASGRTAGLPWRGNADPG